MSILLAPEAEADPVADLDFPSLEIVRLERSPGPGLADALELGLPRSTGELVGYVGPGERLLPGALPALSEALRAPSAVAAYTAFVRSGDGGEPLETVVPEELDRWEILRLQRVPTGPAPLFVRGVALDAIEAEPNAHRFRDLAFWLRVAGKGGLRRLSTPLASRRAGAEAQPSPGGLDAARERIELLERFVAETQRSEESSQRALSAARNALIAAAADIQPGFNDSAERFFVVDRFAPEASPPEGLDPEATLAVLEARCANLEQRLTRQQAALGVLEAAIANREGVLVELEGRPSRRLTSRLARRMRRGASGA